MTSVPRTPRRSAPGQPGAGAQADQPGRAHPPRGGGLRISQRQVPGDLRRAVGRLGPLPGQRRIRRRQRGDHPPGQEPQVGPQRAARRAGQPGRGPRTARSPTGAAAPPAPGPARAGPPNAASRAAAHSSAFARARVPGPARAATARANPAAGGGTDAGCQARDVAGDRVSAATSGRRCRASHTVDIQSEMTGTPGPCHPEAVRPDASHQAEASQIAAELAAIARTGMVLPGSITQRRTRCGRRNCALPRRPAPPARPLLAVDPQSRRARHLPVAQPRPA